jgi:sarcosine oxidase subunit beta
MINKKHYDIVVIGGGVCGSAIAYYLSKSGAKIALFDKGEICSGGSGANLGFSVLTYRKDAVLLNMAIDQLFKLSELAKELEIDIEYVQTGGLIPISNQEELKVQTFLADKCHEWGLKEVYIIDSKQAIEKEPALDPEKIICASYCPLEGKVNPFKLTIGFIRKAQEMGADIYPRTEVTGMEVSNGKVKDILTKRGKIKADLIVVAAGPWTREIVNMVNIDLPVLYKRGEAMASTKIQPTIRGMVTDGRLFTKACVIGDMEVGSCLTQSASGNIIVAQATTKVDNYDCCSTAEGPMRVARRVLSFFPSLSDLQIIRTWGGLFAFAEDMMPIFGFLNKPDNLFIVTGFHSAVCISSAIGQMVQEVYSKGSTSYDVSNYTPQRFIKKNGK